MIAYSYASGFPFSAWGDSLFMALQTMVIAYLILSYAGQSSMGLLFCGAYSGLLFFLTQGFLSTETLGLLQMSNVPIIVVSRLIQVMIFSVKTVIGCYFLLPDFKSRGHPR